MVSTLWEGKFNMFNINRTGMMLQVGLMAVALLTGPSVFAADNSKPFKAVKVNGRRL